MLLLLCSAFGFFRVADFYGFVATLISIAFVEFTSPSFLFALLSDFEFSLNFLSFCLSHTQQFIFMRTQMISLAAVAFNPQYILNKQQQI